jgi:cytosol alanyl aminopeptidase
MSAVGRGQRRRRRLPPFGLCAGQLAALLSRPDIDVRELLANLNDAQALTESGDLPVAAALSLALQFAAHPRREVVAAALDLIASV